MDLLDWALLALVALAFGLALYKTIDNKRRGKSCGGNCSACGLLPAEIKPPQIPVCKRSVKANAFTDLSVCFPQRPDRHYRCAPSGPAARPCAGIPCI